MKCRCHLQVLLVHGTGAFLYSLWGNIIFLRRFVTCFCWIFLEPWWFSMQPLVNSLFSHRSYFIHSWRESISGSETISTNFWCCFIGCIGVFEFNISIEKGSLFRGSSLLYYNFFSSFSFFQLLLFFSRFLPLVLVLIIIFCLNIF